MEPLVGLTDKIQVMVLSNQQHELKILILLQLIGHRQHL